MSWMRLNVYVQIKSTGCFSQFCFKRWVWIPVAACESGSPKLRRSSQCHSAITPCQAWQLHCRTFGWIREKGTVPRNLALSVSPWSWTFCVARLPVVGMPCMSKFRNSSWQRACFFPTCQVRVVRFYVSCPAFSSSSCLSSFSFSSAGPQLQSLDRSVPRWTRTASSGSE